MYLYFVNNDSIDASGLNTNLMNDVSNKIDTDDPNKNNTSNQMNRYSIEHPQGISNLWLNNLLSQITQPIQFNDELNLKLNDDQLILFLRI